MALGQLDGITLAEILVLENYAGRLIDYGVIVPRLQALYDWASADLGEPRLLGLIRNGLPACAWTNDERHPWTPVRGRRIMPLLTGLTSLLGSGLYRPSQCDNATVPTVAM